MGVVAGGDGRRVGLVGVRVGVGLGLFGRLLVLRRLGRLLVPALGVHGRARPDERPGVVGLVLRLVVGDGELAARLVRERGAHVGAPDGNRGCGVGAGGAAVVDARRSAGGAADPHGGRELGREAAEPEVGVVVGGAGLARDGLVGGEVVAQVGRAALGDDGLEDLRGVLDDGGVDDLLGVVLVLVDHVAVAVLDLGDGDGVAMDAPAGDGRERLAHLHDGQLRGAECRREDGLDLGVDAQSGRHVGDLVHADGLGDLDVAGVGGHGRGAREGDDAVVDVLDVARCPRGRHLERGLAVDAHGGAHAVLERGQEHDRLEA